MYRISNEINQQGASMGRITNHGYGNGDGYGNGYGYGYG